MAGFHGVMEMVPGTHLNANPLVEEVLALLNLKRTTGEGTADTPKRTIWVPGIKTHAHEDA